MKELILDNNFIHFIDPLFTKCFWEIRNSFLLLKTTWPKRWFWSPIFSSLPHLVGVNFSSQSWVSNNIIPESVHTEISRNKRQGHACEQHIACPMFFSRWLHWVDVSRSGLQIQQIPELVFMRNSTLNFVKASYTGVESVQFPMYCPFNVKLNIETLDISHNALRCINESTFNPDIGHCDWSPVKYVYLLVTTN